MQLLHDPQERIHTRTHVVQERVLDSGSHKIREEFCTSIMSAGWGNGEVWKLFMM